MFEYIELIFRDFDPSHIRDLVLSFLAPAALYLAWRRTDLADRQTSLQQADTDMTLLRTSAEHLEADQITKRLSAIWSLLALSKANPEAYHVRVMSLFAAFLTYPPRVRSPDAAASAGTAQEPPIDFKSADILAIVQAINERTNEQKKIESEQGFNLAALLKDTAFPLVGANIVSGASAPSST